MSAMHSWLERAATVRRRRHTERGTRVRSGAVLDFVSNDYLGLSRDERLVDAAVRATRRHGSGARASRVVAGTLEVHERLESSLCALSGRQAALALSSGYMANLAVLSALSGPDACILLDAHAHASLIDGARLSRSTWKLFPHRDLDALGRELANRETRRAIVVVESIYSVLGDAAELRETAELCAEHGALLVVDEAHGLGVLGEGRGGVHAAGLAHRDDVVVTCTLSKAMGAMGGAVLASERIRTQLVNAARPFIFDTGLAPAPAAAATAAIEIILSEPALVHRLHAVAALLAGELGLPKPLGPVQSIEVGSAARAMRIADELEAHDVLVGCFRTPSVPDGIARLRFTARSTAEQSSLVRVGALVRQLLDEGLAR